VNVLDRAPVPGEPIGRICVRVADAVLADALEEAAIVPPIQRRLAQRPGGRRVDDAAVLVALGCDSVDATESMLPVGRDELDAVLGLSPLQDHDSNSALLKSVSDATGSYRERPVWPERRWARSPYADAFG
jgi:hypothetical protein